MKLMNPGTKHGLTGFAGLLFLSAAVAAQAVPGAGVIVAGAQTIVAGAQTKVLSPAQASASDKTATPGAVSADKKTLTFRQEVVRLIVHSGPENDMLSCRIDGLLNPTMVIPAGATLQALFINTDDDMTHNLRFTVQKPPFKGAVSSVGTSNLPHNSATVYDAEEMTRRAL